MQGAELKTFRQLSGVSVAATSSPSSRSRLGNTMTQWRAFTLLRHPIYWKCQPIYRQTIRSHSAAPVRLATLDSYNGIKIIVKETRDRTTMGRLPQQLGGEGAEEPWV